MTLRNPKSSVVPRRHAPGRPNCGGAGMPAAIALLGVSLLASGAARAASPVSVTGAWFRYLLSSIPAAGYMTLQNSSAEAIVLTGASSPACGMLMLHRTETAGGVDRMVPVKQVTVPGHGSFRFAPGGYHIMCMRPAMQVGETVPVTLKFSDGDQVHVPFAVQGANGPAGTKMKMPM